MSQLEESNNQFLEFDKEQISQINNLVNLLVDLEIIEPQVLQSQVLQSQIIESLVQTDLQSEEALEKIVCYAYLESTIYESISNNTNDFPQEVEFVEQFVDNTEDIDNINKNKINENN
ncbi:MAG: hypothetical protein HC908_07035, partial [Calothrix sp. SM1_7_51]|nr:hypothetical protein [Calothrix sp. SM1_7_51]